ncbi:MAG: glutathione S-transferase [Alphaproteobacteria bacterium PA2]|nr:MAG: glutathione S-transferase [Alphaproteobacteria bacterium PA2]
MKLYDTAVAPNPRRVRWVMAEKAITDIEVVRLNMAEGQHRTDEILTRTEGFVGLPILEMDDGTTLTESLAICRYLEGRYPEPNLFGRSLDEVAVIEMWTRRAELLVAHPLMIGVRHLSPVLAGLEQQDATVGGHNRDQALKALGLLDQRLKGRDWLAADRLTIADIVAFIGLDFTRLIRMALPENLTEVARWAQAMRERPAAQA